MFLALQLSILTVHLCHVCFCKEEKQFIQGVSFLSVNITQEKDKFRRQDAFPYRKLNAFELNCYMSGVPQQLD